MKILETKQAPNPRRVRIFLAEKGISVAFEINKFQRVPVLVLDDGTAISETVAICRYFEEQQPAPALFGTGAVGRATVEMWNRHMELGLLNAVASAFRHTHPAMATLEVPQITEWGEANKPKAVALLTMLDQELAARRFVAGDAFSIADITALCAIDFMRLSRIQRPEGLAHLDRWYTDVSTRPSAKA
jgi:glutathione S-transferase